MKETTRILTVGAHRQVLFTLLLLTLPHLYAFGAPNYRFNTISVDEGLSHARVNAVIQDNKDFLWLGTFYGLNRYDGSDVKHYIHDPDNPLSLSGNYVWNLFQDSKSRLWVCTWGDGVNLFEQDSETFVRYQHSNEPSSLPSNNVWSMFEDAAGRMWVCSEGGLSRLDPESGRFTTYDHDPDNVESLSHDVVTAARNAPDGKLWVATFGGGLNLFDPETGTVTSVWKHIENEANSLPHNDLWCLSDGSDGRLWIGSVDGLSRFDPPYTSFVNRRTVENGQVLLANNTVTDVIEDEAGNLWITTLGGLSRVAPGSDMPEVLIENLYMPHVYESQEGIIWLSTKNGLAYYDPSQKKFENYLRAPTSKVIGLNSSAVNALLVDERSALWVGTESGGVNRLDPGADQFKYFTHTKDNPQTMSDNEVLSIANDRDGALWIGTASGGLLRMDPETDTFRRYQHDPANKSTIGGSNVSDIAIDGKGRIWLALYGGALDCFEPSTGEFAHFRYDPKNPQTPCSDWAISIMVDSNDNVWIGSEGSGLSHYAPETGLFTHYAPPDQLSDGTVSALFEDSIGNIWIGTLKGLNELDRATGDLTVYTTKDGLPSDAISAIQEDNGGTLWISGSNGLSRFDRDGKQFRNYYDDDGLQHRQFTRHSACKGPDGRLYFGGVNGLSMFLPQDIVDNTRIPKVAITDFTLFNKSVAQGEDSPLETHILNTRQIVLDHTQIIFGFRFVALNYTAASKCQYAYKLEGFDTAWIHTDAKQRVATYTNLDSGEYTFRVKASNNDGVWNEEGTSIDVVILPPWWETLWFRGAMILLAVGIVVTVFRRRVRLIHERSRQLETQVAERTSDLRVMQQNLEALVKERTASLERTYEELRESEQGFRALIENAADCMYLHDMEGKIVNVNQRACDSLGYSREELQSFSVRDLEVEYSDPEDLAALWDSLKEGKPVTAKGAHRRKDNTSFPVEVSLAMMDLKGKPMILASARDISERKRLEAQLRQSQKMEAVGQLAGGIAHDFNNLLQAILGYGDLALDEAGEDSSVGASVKEMMKAGDRAKTLVSQLLAFSRRQVLDMKDVNLNDSIADVMKMLRRVIGEHITLDAISGHDLGIVRADPGQIEQILMNLCVNARDAMGESGKITIETENVRIDEDFCEIHPWAEPGRYALLSVTDMGCGMDEATLSNVFEPFFTTKAVGEGTGLGLATVYGLVKQHDGLIHVYSEVSKGTTFKIYFPFVERTAVTVGDKIEGPVPNGSETILIAEDDEMVRILTKANLEHAGYTALAAVDGEEAIRLFNEHADKIDLALLDVMMPNLGGRAVFERIRETHPEVRVLFSSGYSMNAIHTNFVLDERLTLIQKPYQRDDLLRKVREVLDSEQ